MTTPAARPAGQGADETCSQYGVGAEPSSYDPDGKAQLDIAHAHPAGNVGDQQGSCEYEPNDDRNASSGHVVDHHTTNYRGNGHPKGEWTNDVVRKSLGT
jgi:hypothetical protein